MSSPRFTVVFAACVAICACGDGASHAAVQSTAGTSAVMATGGAGSSSPEGVSAAPAGAHAAAGAGGDATPGGGHAGSGDAGAHAADGGGSGAAGMSTAGASVAAGSGEAGSGVAGNAGNAGNAGSAGASGGATPDPKFLVPASGPCPEFADGYVMFAPDGVQRRVLLYAAPKPGMHGPLVISWHSTLPTPEDAVVWIGQSVIDEIKAQGGVVAAPTSANPSAVRPWDNIPMGPPNTDNDQRLMDEIVACAVTKVGIDVRHIHATGMSAGGLKTAQVSLRRSGYLASVVVYSGGLTAGDNPPDQDPTNPVAAMILYGGPTDISPVDGINYTDASNRYLKTMQVRGSFAFLCNHGGGHSVPNDSQASAWRFMQDHPYGTKPSPYAMKLPDGFLRYCMLSSP